VTEWDAQSSLAFGVRQLRGDLDDLADAINFLPGRLRGLDSQMQQARKETRAVDARTADLETALRDLTAVLKRVDARVEWLERNIRLRESATAVELDDVGGELVEVAAEAESGLNARSHLMSAEDRSGLQALVAEHAGVAKEQVSRLEEALAASRTIAEGGPADDARVAAVTTFRTAARAWEAARSRTMDLAERAEDAQQRLVEDDRRRIRQADVIAAGERAWEALQAALRARVADAVGEGALLPAWFTSVLGPIPPAEDTRSWMDVATDLLAFRVTYGVDDPASALGPEPGVDASARRRAWHQQLRRRLRDLQR
jgi:chromosome segregation ATPase